MEQEIIIFEAPSSEVVRTSTLDEEKYTYLAQVLPYAVVDSIRHLDLSELESQFDSTIPALIVQEIIRYFYPIWDRFDESKPVINKYAIKIPLKTEITGYCYDNRGKLTVIAKSGLSADVVGFKVPKILVPQHRYLPMNPMWEEIFQFPPIVDPRFIILNGHFGLKTISEHTYYLQQSKGYVHVAEYDEPLILFTAEGSDVMITLQRILAYIERIKEFYDAQISVYHSIKTHAFMSFLSKYWQETNKNDDVRSAQIYGSNIVSSASATITTLMTETCSCVMNDFSAYSIHSASKPIDNRDTWWMSLFVHQLNNVYLHVIQHSVSATHILDKIKHDKQILYVTREYGIRLIKYLEEEAIKLSIARSKFGKHVTRLAELTDSQRNIIARDYASYIKPTVVPKNIQHIIRQFQRSLFGPLEQLRASYKSLKSIIHDMSPEEIYDKYTLCPHRTSLAKLLVSDVDNRDAMDRIKIDYAVPDLIEYYGFFCKVCGEMIKRLDTDQMMEFIDFGDIYKSEKLLSDPLESLINKIVSSVVNTDIMFTGITRVLRIVDHISNVIHPQVMTMEKQLQKSKVILVEHMTDLLSIYIHIYTMAILTRMIILNPTHVNFISSFVGGRVHQRVRKKASSSSLVAKTHNAATLLVTAKRILLKNITAHMRKINAIKPEALTGLLVKAYQWASTLKEAKQDADAKKEKVTQIISNIPIYRYLRQAHINAGKKVGLTDYQRVLGRSLAELESCTVDIFTNAPVVEKWKPDFGDGDLDAAAYQYRAYLSEIRYVRNEIYKLVASPYDCVDQRLVQFEHEFDDLLVYEKYRRWRTYLFGIYPTVRPDTSREKPPDYYSPSYRPLNYAQYYTLDGNPREWNIFIYRNTRTGKIVRIPKADIVAWMVKPEFASLKLVDMGALGPTGKLETYETIQNPSVEEAVKKRYTITSMYIYYKDRCPIGDLHEMKASVCSKCKFGAPSMTQDAYYRKYSNVYHDQIREETRDENRILQSIYRRPKLKQPPKIAPWKVTQDVILRWSKAVKIEFNKLYNIGFYWRCEEDYIRDETCDPSVGSTYDDSMYRLSVLKAYYNYVTRVYNSIKYDNMITHTNADLRDIFNKHKSVVRGLSGALPVLHNDLVWVQVDKEYLVDIDTACNFMLSSTANLLLHIDSLRAPHTAIGHDIFVYLTNSILASEMASTRPPPYARLKQRAAAAAAAAVNQYDDTDDDAEDDLVENFSDTETAEPSIQAADNEGEDAMSYNTSDITYSNDGNDNGDEEDENA